MARQRRGAGHRVACRFAAELAAPDVAVDRAPLYADRLAAYRRMPGDEAA
jgi:hypothetical protein